MEDQKIPPSRSGRPEKYSFSSLVPGGKPLIVELPESKKETFQVQANRIRGAASRWGIRNGTTMVTRMITDKGITSLHVYRKGEKDGRDTSS